MEKKNYICRMKNWDSIYREYITHFFENIDSTTFLKYLKDNKICFTTEDIIKAVEYGFKYSTESQHDGKVPIGNILQWIMSQKNIMEIPKEFKNIDKDLIKNYGN